MVSELESEESVTILKVLIVSCTTFHFYYSALHFDEEVEYIWKKKWTAGKVLYLLTKYLGSFFLFIAVAGTSYYNWNDTFDDVLLDEPVGFLVSCLDGELFSGLGPMIILVAEVILQLRVYALYGRSKIVLVFFIILTLVLFVFNIFQMSDLFFNIEETLSANIQRRSSYRRYFAPTIAKDEGKNTCYAALPISGIGWAVTCFVELVLFLLVLAKALRIKQNRFHATPQVFTRGEPRARNITTAIARDSAVYFAIIFGACLICTTLAFLSDFSVTRSEPATVFAFIHEDMNGYETLVITLMTILAPKLLIKLRAEHYGPIGPDTTELSWNADVVDRLQGSTAGSNDPSAHTFEPE